MFEQILEQALKIAEEAYDGVIRRWGNIPFARSTVYNWVWSEEFCLLCHALSESDKGRIRLSIMKVFGVRPWPWYPRSCQENPPSNPL